MTQEDTSTDYLILSETYPHYSSEVINRQIDLEELMSAEGLLRYTRSVDNARDKGRESATGYGRKLVTHYVEFLRDKILDEFTDSIWSGRPGYNNHAFKKIEGLDRDVVALLTLQGLFNTITTESTLQYVAKEIGSLLEGQAMCEHFKKHSPQAYRLAEQRAAENTTHKRQYAAMSAMLSHTADGAYGNEPDSALAWKPWGDLGRSDLGTKLLLIIRDWLRIIHIVRKDFLHGRGSGQYYVEPTAELREWIKEYIVKTGVLRTMHLPCVIPLRHYTGPFDGSYHTTRLLPHSLVKTFNRKHKERLEKQVSKMTAVYDAVNAAQDTAWRINKRVLAVATALWESGSTVAGLPNQEEEPLPRCPNCNRVISNKSERHDCFLDKDVLRSWKFDAKEVHKWNSALYSKRLLVHNIFWMARLFVGDDALYFPYQIDFRGRFYTLPQNLTPQGCDLAKGLLEFAKGKPIETQEAEDWLAIHLANTGGKDKLSFEERIAWVRRNWALFEQIADNPLDDTSWAAEMKEPFSFLAACYEWVDYKRTGKGYSSHIPIAQDGTCSGLQHFSAMLRDTEGAAATNLLPFDTPQDIYRLVAKRTIKVLEEIPTDDPHYHAAQRWLSSGLINRSLAKGPVMTLPYGASTQGTQNKIIEYVEMERRKQPNAFPWSSAELRVACRYLGRVMRSVIEETVASQLPKQWYGCKTSPTLPVRPINPLCGRLLQGCQLFKSISSRKPSGRKSC